MRKKQFKEASVTLGIRVPKSKKEELKKKFDKIVSKYKTANALSGNLVI